MKQFFWLITSWILLPQIALAGVVADAPPLTASLTKILNFLLGLLGTIAILGIVVVGVMYFTAGGDKRQVLLAKRAFTNAIIGIIIALGGMVLVWTITRLLS